MDTSVFDFTLSVNKYFRIPYCLFLDYCNVTSTVCYTVQTNEHVVEIKTILQKNLYNFDFYFLTHVLTAK